MCQTTQLHLVSKVKRLNKYLRYFLPFLLLLLLPGCDSTRNKAQKELNNAPHYKTGSDRVTIERIAIVHDNIAYNNIRGIYIIKDSVTGKEYIGISGIGISEVGDHLSGRIFRNDER